MLCEKVDLAALVFGGRVGRELIAVALDFNLNIGVLPAELGNARLKAALSDVAPRAGDVAPNVNAKSIVHGGYSVARPRDIP